MPKVIRVIESEVIRGKGVPGDVCRTVMQYHSTSGILLAEKDACIHQECDAEMSRLSYQLEQTLAKAKKKE
jgi:hypothetical protein